MAILKRPTSPADLATADADARAEAFIAGAPDGNRLATAPAPAPAELRKPTPARGGRRVQINFTADPVQLAAFDAACAERGVSRSAGLALAMSRAVSEGF